MLSKRYAFDPKFVMRPKYMSSAAMSEMYSGRPVVCSDIIFFQRNPDAVFLAERTLRPAEGLWVIGGSRRAGESAVDAAVRRMEVETGLAVEPDRFQLIAIVEFIWPNRAEPPQDEGRHDVNYVFGLEVSDEEIALVSSRLDPSEYNPAAGLKRFASLHELRAAGVKENILDYYAALFG